MNKNILLIFFLFLFSVVNTFAEEIKIGLILTLTGPFADLGDDAKRGIDLAIDSKTNHGQLDNYKISFIYGDSQAEPKIGINEFNRLVNQEKVLAILTMRSTIGMSLNPFSKAKKIPLVGAVGHPKFTLTNEYAFQFWPSTDHEGAVLSQKALELGYKDVIVITSEDDWTLSLTEGFQNSFEKNGGKISLSKTVLPGETDFQPVVTQIKSKKTDAIFVNSSLNGSALMVKRIREQGIKLPILANFWMGDQNAIKTAGIENVEGIIFPEVSLKYPGFEERLNRLHSTPKRPSGMTYSTYAGMAFFLETLQENKNISDNVSFYSALNKKDQVKLLDGVVKVKDRRVIFPVVIKTIKNGKVIE